jgi:hypothetical protein
MDLDMDVQTASASGVLMPVAFPFTARMLTPRLSDKRILSTVRIADMKQSVLTCRQLTAIHIISEHHIFILAQAIADDFSKSFSSSSGVIWLSSGTFNFT